MHIGIELVLKIGAFIISLSLLIKGIYEYTKAQKWKKAEFVSKEIKEFNNDFDIKRAMILLDWNSSELALKTNEIEGENKFYFNDDLIISALQTHKESHIFSVKEVIIKGVFDSLFDRLTMFDNYIETGLIRTKDIKPYLIYWIRILADSKNDRKSKEVRNQIWHYIDEYGYDRIRSFCYKFGFKDQ
jgi:hypothetical protein